MSVSQRINDFISSQRPKAICNVCIADGVGLTNKTAHPNQVAAALETTSDFDRRRGICGLCGKEALVIQRI